MTHFRHWHWRFLIAPIAMAIVMLVLLFRGFLGWKQHHQDMVILAEQRLRLEQAMVLVARKNEVGRAALASLQTAPAIVLRPADDVAIALRAQFSAIPGLELISLELAEPVIFPANSRLAVTNITIRARLDDAQMTEIAQNLAALPAAFNLESLAVKPMAAQVLGNLTGRGIDLSFKARFLLKREGSAP